jgi:hypothetical protein
MNKIVEIQYKGDYTIWMRFADGFAKEVDFKPIVGEGISAPLLNVEYFGTVAIDNGGGLEWPNGFDCCPNYLRDLVATQQAIAS